MGCAIAALLSLVAAALFGEFAGLASAVLLAKAGVRSRLTLEAVPLLATLLGFTAFLWASLRLYRSRARSAAAGIAPIVLGDDALALFHATGAAEIPYSRIDAVWVLGEPGGPLQAVVVRDADGRPHAASGGGLAYNKAIEDLRARAAPRVLARLRAAVEAGRDLAFHAPWRKGGGLLVGRSGVRPIGAPAADEVPWARVKEVREERSAARVVPDRPPELFLPRDAENFVFFGPLVEALARPGGGGTGAAARPRPA
jgi:hypothetical protein